MATEAEGKTKQTEMGPEVFDDYDAFLKQAIRDYYDRGWKSRRGTFIALVMASGQVTSMAADSIKRRQRPQEGRAGGRRCRSRCESACATRCRARWASS